MLLGSDAPQIYNVPGFSTHRELEFRLLVQLGVALTGRHGYSAPQVESAYRRAREACGETAQAEPAETVDLSAVLRDVQDVGEALAGGKPVEVRLDAPDGLTVAGDAGALRRLLLPTRM